MRKHYSVHSVDEKIKHRKVPKIKSIKIYNLSLCEILCFRENHYFIAWCENICHLIMLQKRQQCLICGDFFHTITQSMVRLGF